MTENYKEIVYYILQDKYLNKFCEKEKLDKNIIDSTLFPKDWFIAYSIDDKIEMISRAIKDNIKLIDIVEDYNMLK